MYTIYKLSETEWVVVDPEGNVFSQRQTQAEAKLICDQQNDTDILFEVYKKLNQPK